MKQLMIGLCALVFVGCQNALVKPRESVAIGYTAVESVADLVAIAKRDGHINTDKRDELIELVAQADALLDTARLAINAGDDADGLIAEARAILTVVRDALPGVE